MENKALWQNTCFLVVLFRLPNNLCNQSNQSQHDCFCFLAFHALLASRRSAFGSNLRWKTKLYDKTQIFQKYEFRLDRNTIFKASSSPKSHPSWAKINAQWDIKHDDGKNCQESLSDHFLLLKEASGTPQTLPRSSPSGVQIPFSATSDLFLVTLDFLGNAPGDIWTTKLPVQSVFLVDGSNFGDEFQANCQHVPRRYSRSVYN